MVTFECCLKESIILWAALFIVSEFKKVEGAMLQLFGTLGKKTKITVQNRPNNIKVDTFT